MILLCIKTQKQWKQIRAVCGILPEMNETPFKIFFFFWTNETSIYTTTWRSRCCQLHRLARLNTNARRYISWRRNWYIYLTVVIFWICLRFSEMSQKDRHFDSKIHCLTLDLFCTAVLGTIFFSVNFFLEISLLIPWKCLHSLSTVKVNLSNFQQSR